MTGGTSLPILIRSTSFSGSGPSRVACTQAELHPQVGLTPGLEGILAVLPSRDCLRCVFLCLPSWRRLAPAGGAPLHSLTEATHPIGNFLRPEGPGA